MSELVRRTRFVSKWERQTLESPEHLGGTFLHHACDLGQLDMICRILSVPGFDANVRNDRHLVAASYLKPFKRIIRRLPADYLKVLIRSDPEQFLEKLCDELYITPNYDVEILCRNNPEFAAHQIHSILCSYSFWSMSRLLTNVDRFNRAAYIRHCPSQLQR